VIVDFIKNNLTGALTKYRKWKDITQKIRHYRNTLAHNPKLGMYQIENTLYVPKEEKLSFYSSWSSISSPVDIRDFTLLCGLLEKYQKLLTRRTNQLWTDLIELMKEIKPKLSDYNFNNENFQFETNPIINLTSPPSGTSSVPPSGVSSSTVTEINAYGTHITPSGTLLRLPNQETDDPPLSE
jgi:hypothetical protein